MEIKKINRDYSIDLLKVIGLFLVILAHTNPSNLITQIRSFDVVLLVIISGYLGKISYNKNKNIIAYIKSRFIRLVIPTWIFLTIYFIILFLFKFDFSIKTILESYLFLDGIGYVWIIRIYLITALSLPFLLYINNKIKNYAFILIVLLYIFYEVLFIQIGENNVFIKYIFNYFVPYGLLCTYIGTILDNKNMYKTITVLSLITFIISFAYFSIINNKILLFNIYKYPPRIYYLSYGIIVTLLIFKLKNKIIKLLNNESKKIIMFISAHSLWIYLWHIIIVKICDKYIPNYNYIIRYIIIITFSLLIVLIQSNLVKKLNIKNKNILTILSC